MSLNTKLLELDRTEILFEKKRYAIQSLDDRVGQMARDSLRYDEREDYQLGALAKRLSVDILTRKLVDQIYEDERFYSYPSSWWQHFKRDYMPEWFKKRYPVHEDQHRVTLKVQFERYANYPESDIVLPDRFGQMYLYENVRDITKEPRWN